MKLNTQELKNFEFGNATDVGCVRDVNEDYLGYFQVPNGHLFIVCDGMGGHLAGETASQLAVETFKDYFFKKHYDNPQKALFDATIEANHIIFDTSQKMSQYAGMGTTLVATLIENNEIFYVHVGDSRLYYFENQTNTLHRITKDHSFVQQLVDNNVIKDHEMEFHPRKNEILQALGVKSVVEPDVCKLPILPANGDIMLLCSDGLNGMINDETIKNIIIQNEIHLIERTQKLIESAKKAGGTDNITAQLVKFYAQNREKTIIPSISTRTLTPALSSAIPNISVEKPVKENPPKENQEFQQKKAFNAKKIIIPGVILVVFLGFFVINFFQNKAETEKKQREKIAKFTADSLQRKNDSLVKIVKENLEKDAKDSLTKMEKAKQDKKDSLKDAKKDKIDNKKPVKAKK